MTEAHLQPGREESGQGGQRVVLVTGPSGAGRSTAIHALEDLGYVSDASYPMYFYQKQLEPYHPAAEDWTKKGSLRMVEIPNFADLSLESTDTYGRDRDQWPKFRTESAEKLLTHVDNFLRYLEAQGVTRRVLAFYFHPWEFHPMPQGVLHFGEGGVVPDPFITANCGDYALEQLDALLTGLKARGARFKTAAQIASET